MASLRHYNFNMVSIPRFVPAILVALLAVGCGRSYMPSEGSIPPASAPAGEYPVRTDLMVVKLLDGAPKRWPSTGFPPLRSARNPAATPDRDIAEELRKQFGKNILDPTRDLTPAQAAQLARMLENTFGAPAQPRVGVPSWEEVEVHAVFRPKSMNAFANFVAFASAVPEWKADPWRKDWTQANRMKAELKLDDSVLARGSVLYRRWCMQCHGPSGAGDGAHAIELAAMPRDYRQGIFKFITAFPPASQPGAVQPKKKGQGPSGKPLRHDLKRTVRNGLDGTMMPAFPSLSEQELDDVVSYLRHCECMQIHDSPVGA